MLILAGFVPKDIIHNYYYSADATILVSLQEGFGLSIIEGFVYGKPNVTYADLSSLPDVYDKGAMIVVAERNPKMLAKAMIEASQRVWDNEMIAEYSNRFSLEEMSNRYLNILNTI